MRARSKKTAQRYVHRRALVVEQLALHPHCARCGSPAEDVHEVVSRGRGGSILDVSNVVTLCRNCHTWITDNPALAETQGWSKRSGAQRHEFTAQDGFYCDRCGLPNMNWRHREDAA